MTTATNGVSSPCIGMSRLLLGGRPSRTLAATTSGVTHMVHRCDLREWTNPHGARFTDWRAGCGASGTLSGHVSAGMTFGLSSIDYAHRDMLCSVCCEGLR